MAGNAERVAVRVDAWIWAVRLVKSRSLATAACKAGHVRVNGEKAKPSTAVKAGDEVRYVGDAGPKIVEVVRVINKRVGAPAAAEAIIDHSPPPIPREEAPIAVRRDRGAGRPTKRERRQIDRLRGRDSWE